MPAAQLVALKCSIARGAFSDERVFTVALPQGEYTGIASRRYCWNERDEPLNQDEPAAGRSIGGKVAARVVEVENGTGNALVSVPDGEVITVRADQIVQRPTGVGTHVPV